MYIKMFKKNKKAHTQFWFILCLLLFLKLKNYELFTIWLIVQKTVMFLKRVM